MRESTFITLGRLAAQRRAQEAAEAPGRARWNSSMASAGGLARAPPFTGSMMTSGTPRFSVRA